MTDDEIPRSEIEAVADITRSALVVLDDAGVPPQLRETVFPCVFGELASRSGQPSGPAALAPTTPEPALAEDPPGVGLERLAARLGTDVDVVDAVYVLDGDELDLVVAGSRLATSKSGATEQIALLITAGRQGAGLDADGWTDIEHVRRMSERYRRYDANNFAAAINRMDDLLQIRAQGRDRTLRMSKPAWGRAGELVRRLGEGS